MRVLLLHIRYGSDGDFSIIASLQTASENLENENLGDVKCHLLSNVKKLNQERNGSYFFIQFIADHWYTVGQGTYISAR